MKHQPRIARASDYPAIAAVVDDWWGRPILAVLPRLFLDHFPHTSLVIDGPGGPLAFLIGILSPADPRQAYVAFHRAMGFSVTGPLADYDGPGHDLVRFDRAL